MGVSQINERQLNKNLKEIINNAATKEELEEVKKSVSDGKAAVANAITNKGVSTMIDAEFAIMADNINSIITTNDVINLASKTYTPSINNQIISAGQYIKEDQIIEGSSNLKPENIKAGITIFNVTGTMEEGIQMKSVTKSFSPTSQSAISLGLTQAQIAGAYFIKIGQFTLTYSGARTASNNYNQYSGTATFGADSYYVHDMTAGVRSSQDSKNTWSNEDHEGRGLLTIDIPNNTITLNHEWYTATMSTSSISVTIYYIE